MTPLPQPLSSAKRVLVALLVFLGIALSVAKGLLWSRGVWNAEVSGYAISALFISLVIAYLIAGRKKNWKPVLFGLTFVGIARILHRVDGRSFQLLISRVTGQVPRPEFHMSGNRVNEACGKGIFLLMRIRRSRALEVDRVTDQSE